MSLEPMISLFATFIFLSLMAFGLWAWFALDHVEHELSTTHQFEGMHFDIEPRTVFPGGGSDRRTSPR